MHLELDEAAQAIGAVPRSPWETLSSSLPSPALGLSPVDSDPLSVDVQLAPEVEVGNVEYKLKLLSPTPDRFTRLVTQLKWRLLAGSGQALYEIGVSDSGQLIGLSRKNLDESLDTLERMAGELGATMIVQKEITIPPSPLNLDILGHGQVDGAPRIPRIASPPVIADSDVSPLSLTDAEGSDDDIISQQAFQPPNGVDATIARWSSFVPQQQSSPLPIIRDYPYGFNAWSFSRTPPSSQLSASPLGTPASLPTFSEADSDVDDDAAFAFDLDIRNFSRTTNSAHSEPALTGADERAPNAVENQRHHRQTKHKKPKLIQSPPIDPIDKAMQRRARRESKREQRRPELWAERTHVKGRKSQGGSEMDELGVSSGIEQVREKDEEITNVDALITPRSASSQLTLSDNLSEVNEAASSSPGVKTTEDASCPRLIAEALIVRKFTVEVEETYFELGKIRL